MFLGNLSIANEHKARKKGSGKKKSANDGEESCSSEKSQSDVPRRLKVAILPIKYTEDSIPREVLLNFLQTCVKMMLDTTNIDEIVEDTFVRKIGLNQSAIDFQRDALENNFQIEKNFGCKYLSQIPIKHEGDVELIEAAKEFMFTAMRSYINALRARCNRYKASPSLKPKDKVPLDRNTILEFFEGCNALMAMPETKDELKLIFKTTGKPPAARVVEMQRSILVLLGHDADFGVSCLNRINEDFPGDRELIGKMQYYATCAEVSCQEATFSEEQRVAFYSQIPPLMHHFPHIFVMQQRMQHQQQQMKQQQMNQMYPPPSSGGGKGGGTDIEALKQSGVLALLSSPEGRLRVQELAGRVQSSRARLQEEVPTWSSERKTDYLNGFSEHPVLVKLGEGGESDPMAKINTFVEMSDADLDQMMTLMLLVASDASLAGEALERNGSSNSAVNGILTTMSSLSNFNKFGPPTAPPVSRSVEQHDGHDHNGHDHNGHDHGHSHAHGESCNHHPVFRSKDVSSGRADTMDR